MIYDVLAVQQYYFRYIMPSSHMIYDVLASSINERSFEKYVCTFVYGMSFVVTLGLIK